MQQRCEAAKRTRKSENPFFVDESFGAWVVGARFDLHGRPVATASDQQVDLAVGGAQVARDDAVARAAQGCGRQRFAGLAGTL